jgi:hypothetical protein
MPNTWRSCPAGSGLSQSFVFATLADSDADDRETHQGICGQGSGMTPTPLQARARQNKAGPEKRRKQRRRPGRGLNGNYLRQETHLRLPLKPVAVGNKAKLQSVRVVQQLHTLSNPPQCILSCPWSKLWIEMWISIRIEGLRLWYPQLFETFLAHKCSARFNKHLRPISELFGSISSGDALDLSNIEDVLYQKQ